MVVEREDTASQDTHNAVRTYRGPDLFAHPAQAASYCDLILGRHAQDRPIFEIGFTATMSAEHRAQAMARRVGHRITLDCSGPAGIGVAGDFHIESVMNTIADGGKVWSVDWELSPAGTVNRADTKGSDLSAGINSSVTAFDVDVTGLYLWITDAAFRNMFPFEVTVGAEDMRVTGVIGASSPQTFTVERGINGTAAAAHLAGAAVSLADPWTLP